MLCVVCVSLCALQACAHTFFDELREPGTKLPNGRELPVLFNFTEQVGAVTATEMKL